MCRVTCFRQFVGITAAAFFCHVRVTQPLNVFPIWNLSRVASPSHECPKTTAKSRFLFKQTFSSLFRPSTDISVRCRRFYPGKSLLSGRDVHSERRDCLLVESEQHFRGGLCSAWEWRRKPILTPFKTPFNFSKSWRCHSRGWKGVSPRKGHPGKSRYDGQITDGKLVLRCLTCNLIVLVVLSAIKPRSVSFPFPVLKRYNKTVERIWEIYRRALLLLGRKVERETAVDNSINTKT